MTRVTTKADRLKKIRLVQTEIENLKSKGRGYGAACEAAWQLAHAHRMMLGYTARHVNLETGELTISLHESEEVAS